VCRTGTLQTLGARCGVSACSARIRSRECNFNSLFQERKATSGSGEDRTTAASRREFLPDCPPSDRLAVGFPCLSTASTIKHKQCHESTPKVDFHKHLRPIAYVHIYIHTQHVQELGHDRDRRGSSSCGRQSQFNNRNKVMLHLTAPPPPLLGECLVRRGSGGMQRAEEVAPRGAGARASTA
jgi:hypothetical protein